MKLSQCHMYTRYIYSVEIIHDIVAHYYALFMWDHCTYNIIVIVQEPVCHNLVMLQFVYNYINDRLSKYTVFSMKWTY